MDNLSKTLLRQAKVGGKIYWCLSFVKGQKSYLAYVTHTAHYAVVTLVKGKEENRIGSAAVSRELAVQEVQKLIADIRRGVI
jgi:hypothetical protein